MPPLPSNEPVMSVDKKQVFSSVRWLALGQVATQAARLVVSVVLARLLAPQAFGLLAMAAVFTSVAGLFSTLGTAPVIVQQRTLSEPLLRSLATLGIAMGLVISGGLAAGAWLFGAVFAEPRVVSVVAALGVSFAIASIGIVPEGLLQREMQFGRLVAIDILQLVVGSTVSIVLALAGADVWSLVIGNLAGAAVRTVALTLASPWRLRLGFDRAAIKGVLGFSAGVLGFNLMQYFTRYTDRLVIGRMLGATNLGYYDYANRFYFYPAEVITSVLLRVMFPTFSRLQGDVVQLGRAFLRTNGAIAFVTFPMMAGLAAVADPFVRVVMGERWAPIIPLIQILAPVGMLTSLGATPGQLFLAFGKAGLRFWWSVIYTAVIAAAVILGVTGGLHGVAIAYASVMVPINLAAFWLALRLVNLRLDALWVELRATIILTALMAAVVVGLRLILTQAHAPQSLVLAACIAAGAVVYTLGARAVAPPALADLYELLPSAARRAPLVGWMFARVAGTA